MFERERAFSAEVAHELRTPIAGLLSTIEVCLRQPRKPDDYRDSLRTCRAICRQCEQMVETLLQIARLEDDATPLKRRRTDLGELLDKCWSLVAGEADAKQLSVTWNRPEHLEFDVDVDKIQVVVINLMQNAVSHGNQGGMVRISLETTDSVVRLSIRNTGNQLSPEDVPGIFERFWRGDVARSQTGTHFGLGLSLVQRLVTLLGGWVEASVQETWFCIAVELPREDKDPASLSEPDIGARQGEHGELASRTRR